MCASGRAGDSGRTPPWEGGLCHRQRSRVLLARGAVWLLVTTLKGYTETNSTHPV